ncbi:hypothetical protein D9615_007616 [Tricholomella constricta]|uniref:ASX DEUBAD domain-containing protein n=1 Tax=Tricholomella constricta TaxID=117010 RepID=A0A8H5M264_9AGAR|nr:hypothetical protein D9615_007616 [Tricholomella constricta]
MHNIADPLIFYFASMMPCQNGAERTGFEMHVSSDALLRDHESAFWSGGSTALENSQSDWNSVDLNPLDSLFLCDTTLLHPSPSYGPHTSGNSEDTPSWGWEASSASESPMISEDSVPVASTSSSPTNNFMYSYDDPTPSPLQLNEFSNVIDFDFSSSSMQNDYILSESQPSSLPSSLSRRRSPRPLRNVPSPDFHKSREVSPTHSDSDHKRRFPCQILGCARRFTSQYTLKDLINAASWNMLSPDSQQALKVLLPPTAIVGFRTVIDPDHPSAADSMSVDEPAASSSGEVDTAVFTDSHFLAAAHTLQDHIYSDWMSESHVQKVKKYEEGIRNGTMSAPWKDEVWEQNNTSTRPSAPANFASESGARAGEAAEVKLVTLAKNDVLRVGDIIALKRNFLGLDLIVEKDAIIQAIHPKTHALTVLFEPGMTKHLPAQLLAPEPAEPSAPTQVACITSPTQLETALLDNDGRIERARRPNGNAWKCMTVWRWRGEPMGDTGDGRWGRENHGTLFYLRGTYYHER